MTKWSKAKRVFCAAYALLSLSGCYSFGVQKTPEQPKAFQLKACKQSQLNFEREGLKITLDYLGPSASRPTARTPWGTIQRYVYPFTRSTVLFALDVQNQSKETLWLDPASMSLLFHASGGAVAHVGEGTVNSSIEAPLKLDFFERAWPAAAVRSEKELLDRSLAMSEVYQKTMISRPVMPGENYTAWIAFRRFQTPPGELKMEQWRWGQREFNHAFCLNFESSQPKHSK